MHYKCQICDEGVICQTHYYESRSDVNTENAQHTTTKQIVLRTEEVPPQGHNTCGADDIITTNYYQLNPSGFIAPENITYTQNEPIKLNTVLMPTFGEMFGVCEKLSGGQYAEEPFDDMLERVKILQEFLLSPNRQNYVKEMVTDGS